MPLHTSIYLYNIYLIYISYSGQDIGTLMGYSSRWGRSAYVPAMHCTCMDRWNAIIVLRVSIIASILKHGLKVESIGLLYGIIEFIN